MEQIVNGLKVDLSEMSEDGLKNLRHYCESAITQAINGVNTINVELNTRIGRTALLEFGVPFGLTDNIVLGEN